MRPDNDKPVYDFKEQSIGDQPINPITHSQHENGHCSQGMTFRMLLIAETIGNVVEIAKFFGMPASIASPRQLAELCITVPDAIIAKLDAEEGE